MSANIGAVLCLRCSCPPFCPRLGQFSCLQTGHGAASSWQRLSAHQQKEIEGFLRPLFRYSLSLSLSPRDKREHFKKVRVKWLQIAWLWQQTPDDGEARITLSHSDTKRVNLIFTATVNFQQKNKACKSCFPRKDGWKIRRRHLVQECSDRQNKD